MANLIEYFHKSADLEILLNTLLQGLYWNKTLAAICINIFNNDMYFVGSLSINIPNPLWWKLDNFLYKEVI